MGKFSTDPITLDDIKVFLSGNHDSSFNNFAFELEVCKAIIEEGESDIKFGGIYFDSDLKHNRQFDIRLKIHLPKKNIYLHLAIECKKLAQNNPLIVATSPRMQKESFLQIWRFVHRSENRSENGVVVQSRSLGNDIFVVQENKPDLYPIEEFAGRMCSQLGKHIDKQIGFIESDSQCYDKWAQAFSSLAGMLHEACNWFLQQENQNYFVWGNHIFIPILLIPDDTLWSVDYLSPDSSPTPCQKNRISLFSDRNYNVPGPHGGFRSYAASHLEIMTLSGLKSFLRRAKTPDIPITATSSHQTFIYQK